MFNLDEESLEKRIEQSLESRYGSEALFGVSVKL